MLRARVTAIAAAVLALAALVAATHSSRADAQAAVMHTSGALAANSKNGSAILSGQFGPGDSLSGTVAISNIGSAADDFTLSMSSMVDTPGAGGGSFASGLVLAVDDVTDPLAPVSVYNGSFGAFNPLNLGSFGIGVARVYRVTVSWPDGGAADAAYAGSALSVQFDWSTGELSGGSGGGSGGDGQGNPPPVTTPPPPSPRLFGPKLSFSVAKKQKVLKHKKLAAKARCDQACRLTVTAKLSVKGVRKAVKLRKMQSSLSAGKATKLQIKLPQAILRKVTSGLRKHKKPTIKLTVIAVGVAGKSKPMSRTVRLTG
ncbi:MAG TPA: hypothetical protein VGI67_22415 [Thermoleophilaceae bacterium]|jgi:hypothetical protein